MSYAPFLNVLVAYPYLKKPIVAAMAALNAEFPGRIRYLIDSGAFTIYKSGGSIKLADYENAIGTLPFKPAGCFMLDVIGDPKATRANYDIMRRDGFDPIPVLTFNEESSAVEEYYAQTDYISLGGLQFIGKPKRIAIISRFAKIIGKRKWHILGQTGGDIIKHFRPTSCDSSSFTSGARFGSLRLYAGNGEFSNDTRKDFTKPPSACVMDRLRRMGYAVSDLQHEDNWRQKTRLAMKINAHSHVIGYSDIERNVGTHMYFAVNNVNELSEVAHGFRKEIDRANATRKA